MDSRWANLFDVSGGCSSLGYTAACHGVTSPDAYLQAQMRSFFGDRWFDLPGNNNERERGEAAYERMVSKAFAAYAERKNSQKKPKLKPPKPRKQRTSAQRDKDKKKAEERRAREAKQGNSEDDQPKNTLTIEHFNAAQESWIRYEMRTILAEPCAHAYEAEGLHSPSQIKSNRGIIIRHAKDLAERSAANLGLDAETYRDAQTKVNSGQGGTVFGIDGTLQIYLNSYAFVGPSWDGKYFSLAEALKHEFIHEGIREWRSLWHPLSHDLRGFPGYDRIMEGCK